jgi:integrase
MQTFMDISEPEKRHAGGTTHPKSDLRYWRTRVYKPISGKGITSNHFMVKLQYQGRRQAFSLHTASSEEAAFKAKSMYQDLVSGGWQFILDKYRPKPPEPTAVTGLTFGDYVALVRSKNLVPDKTLNGYVMRARQIVADIKGIARTRRIEWFTKVDSVPLGSITPDDVRRWKRQSLAKAGHNSLKRQQLSISVNSTLRQARSLFGERKILKHLPQVPRPLPFDGVEFEPRVSTKFYGAGLGAPELLRRALDELETEQLKAFLLAIGLGLRRREADHLTWSSFNFAGGTVRVQPTEYYELKTVESAAVLAFDPEFMTLFKGWHAQATGPFVLESERLPRGETSWAYYRANETFNALVVWLRRQGIRGNKPFHILRKIYGSLIAEAHGIHAASSALRHTSIEMTSSVYADRSVKVSSGLGIVISGAPVIPISSAAAKAKQSGKR